MLYTYYYIIEVDYVCRNLTKVSVFPRHTIILTTFSCLVQEYKNRHKAYSRMPCGGITWCCIAIQLTTWVDVTCLLLDCFISRYRYMLLHIYIPTYYYRSFPVINWHPIRPIRHIRANCFLDMLSPYAKTYGRVTGSQYFNVMWEDQLHCISGPHYSAGWIVLLY